MKKRKVKVHSDKPKNTGFTWLVTGFKHFEDSRHCPISMMSEFVCVCVGGGE